MERLAILVVPRYECRRHDTHCGEDLVRSGSATYPVGYTSYGIPRFIMRESGGVVTSHFRYTKVLLLVIESAMIYSAALLVEITLYFIGSNAFYIVYDPIAQLTVCPISFQSLVHSSLRAEEMRALSVVLTRAPRASCRR